LKLPPQIWPETSLNLLGKQTIAQRAVFHARPGITGLAQIQNIDMSTPEKLAITDAKMLETLNLRYYFTYIIQAILGKGSGDKVRNFQ
jgi:O-antigen biosynthesis protein WbqP